jgi:hypothetical protein
VGTSNGILSIYICRGGCHRRVLRLVVSLCILRCSYLVLPTNINVGNVGIVVPVCVELFDAWYVQGTVAGTVCGDGGNPFSEPCPPCRRCWPLWYIVDTVCTRPEWVPISGPFTCIRPCVWPVIYYWILKWPGLVTRLVSALCFENIVYHTIIDWIDHFALSVCVVYMHAIMRKGPVATYANVLIAFKSLYTTGRALAYFC